MPVNAALKTVDPESQVAAIRSDIVDDGILPQLPHTKAPVI
jgi:hypothetical protein